MFRATGSELGTITINFCMKYIVKRKKVYRVPFPPENGGWETRSKDNKRRKRSSGGTFETSEQNNRGNLNLNLPSRSQFRELSTDEKLVTLFEIMMSHIPSASARLNRTED